MTACSLRQRLTRQMANRLAAFFASMILVVGALLAHYLWQQWQWQIKNVLLLEQNRMSLELGQLAESAERIARSLPRDILTSDHGPYEHVDAFTKEIELYALDLGWILEIRGGRVVPWIDGHRRLVLHEPRERFLTEVAADLTARPWPQSGEGSGRAYQFLHEGNQLVFLHALPVYLGTHAAAYVLVGRVLSSDSVLADSLVRHLGSDLVSAFSVIAYGRELFRIGSPAAFGETAMLAPLKAYGFSLKIHSSPKNVGQPALAGLIITALLFALGAAGLLIWMRRAVSHALTPLQELVQGTTSLAEGDFSVRVPLPREEELSAIAERFNTLASTLSQTMADLAESARREEELLRRGLEAEVEHLRSQLQPHFLFNSLSMVAQAIGENPPRAFDMAIALADLYRAILRTSDRVSHSLREELELVEAYLRIQKMRFEERLVYVIPEITSEFDLQVPCLALQNLVENAVRHGIAPVRHGGTIRFSVHSEQGWVRIEIRNDGLPFPQSPVEGTGLRNTRRRWTLLHGSDATLDVGTDVSGETIAVLACRCRQEVAAT